MLQLPNFAGKIEQYMLYPSFINIFEYLFGRVTSLLDTEKVYYLVGILDGVLKTLVSLLSIICTAALDLIRNRSTFDKSSLKDFLNIILECTKGLKKKTLILLKLTPFYRVHIVN